MSSIPLILTALLGGFTLLVLAIMGKWTETEEEEEDHSTHVEVATGSGGGGHSESHEFEETVKAEISNRKGGGTVRLDGVISGQKKKHKKGAKGRGVETGSLVCKHCGSVNDSGTKRCWNCGSDPSGTISDDKINTVNERIKEGALDDSYNVQKDEEPKEEPVETPATPQEEQEEQKTQEQLGTTEDEVRDDDIPIWRYWIGRFKAWVDKWISLTNTHMRSMIVVSLIFAVIWSLGLIYGSVRLGPSGFVSLFGASIIAIVSAALMVLFALAPGRKNTVVLAYPFAVNAILLPPIVIAIYEPVLSFIWDWSELVAIFFLNEIVGIFGYDTTLRENFEMTEQRYLLMWFILAYPIGWTLAFGGYIQKRIRSKISEKGGG